MHVDRSVVSIIIPARYGSTRFPGKPLAELGGKPLIQHAYEKASLVTGIHQVIIATDDPRIQLVVENFGGIVHMVSEPCRTGTDRVAVIARALPSQILVNLQADEILLTPTLLTDLIDPFLESDALMGTLSRKWPAGEPIENPSVVKLVSSQEGKALYFSRAPIPHLRDRQEGGMAKPLASLHLGVYIFQREALFQFAAWPTGALEDIEKLEQLRALEYGLPI
ncbi:MAG: 3-deoxy-manno-octulosonate cytidylyltransferase, partial [Nitrospirota bacterium]|nr:3-deoxy-manno-octulosonate cytidylyltransferase [Nitrospirota bacterium]